MTREGTCGVQDFDAVCTSASGGVRIPVEEGVVDVGHEAVEASAVDTQTCGTGFEVQAGHVFDRADDVTNTQREAAVGRVETCAVEVRAARSVITALSLCTEASTQGHATVGFGRHVELQTQTAGDVGGANAVCGQASAVGAGALVAVVVIKTKTAVTADPEIGRASCRERV